MNHLKRPRDPSQLAKLMIDIAAGEATDSLPPNAAALASPCRQGYMTTKFFILT